VPHARSSSSLARLNLSRRSCAPRFAELSFRAEIIFAAQENRAFDRVFDGCVTTSRFGSLPDRGLLLPTRVCDMGVAHVARVFLSCAYINSYPATAAQPETNLGFASLYLCHHHSLPHPERRRASTNGRAGLRNHSPL
jgi:hypothetical protein